MLPPTLRLLRAKSFKGTSLSSVELNHHGVGFGRGYFRRKVFRGAKC